MISVAGISALERRESICGTGEKERVKRWLPGREIFFKEENQSLLRESPAGIEMVKSGGGCCCA